MKTCSYSLKYIQHVKGYMSDEKICSSRLFHSTNKITLMRWHHFQPCPWSYSTRSRYLAVNKLTAWYRECSVAVSSGDWSILVPFGSVTWRHCCSIPAAKFIYHSVSLEPTPEENSRRRFRYQPRVRVTRLWGEYNYIILEPIIRSWICWRFVIHRHCRCFCNIKCPTGSFIIKIKKNLWKSVWYLSELFLRRFVDCFAVLTDYRCSVCEERYGSFEVGRVTVCESVHGFELATYWSTLDLLAGSFCRR